MVYCSFQLTHGRLFLQQLESLPAMVAGVYSDDPATQLEATTQFRKLLSIGTSSRGFLFDWVSHFCRSPGSLFFILPSGPHVRISDWDVPD